MEAARFALILQVLYSVTVEERAPLMETCRFVHDRVPASPNSAQVAMLNDVRSSVDCARRCKGSFRPDCRSYGYDKHHRQCVLFNKNRASSGYPPGFKFYTGCTKISIGDSCGDDGDCDVTNAECRGSKCQCVIGFHFYPGPGTCVEVCPNGYGDDFYEIKGFTLLEHNDKHYEEISLQRCLDHCRNNPLCSNAHHSECDCYLSYSTRPQIPDSAWKTSNSYDYYQRYCA